MSDGSTRGLGPVVEGDSSGRLLLAEEGRRLHLGVAEAQVLMEIIQAVDKVANMAAQHLEVETDGDSQVFQRFALPYFYYTFISFRLGPKG